MKNRSWDVLGTQSRFGDASGRARDGPWTPKCRPKADLGAPRASQERPRAVQKRRRGAPETLQEPPGQLPRRSERRSRRQPQSEALADRFLIDFRSTRGGSEVRFALVFTVFFRCRTFCASNACRTQKLRKNNRFGLQNRGPGRPGDPRASKFEQQNGQVERKSALEVPAGPPKINKWPRARQLRARKRDQCPRGAGGPPSTPSVNFGIFEWIKAAVDYYLPPS